jgi:glutamate synthase domain-containing protein 3
MRIDAADLHYRELNQQVRQAVAAGERSFELVNVNGQRYIADGLQGPITFAIHGVPGNDLGAFMDGPVVTVHGNAQDAVANTMNAGRIVVHGHAGDVLGYGMRGGQLLVRGNVGYRVGIHMKAYLGGGGAALGPGDRLPVLVAGGVAGDFLGEYMAGGALIVLGLDRRPGDPLVGDWCATGMHGGVVYLRGEVDPARVATRFVAIRPADKSDKALIRPYIEAFTSAFGLNAAELLDHDFLRIAPISHRPYGAKYAA